MLTWLWLGAYWLLDGIALAQCFVEQVAAEAFQVWKLTVREDRSAALACGDGNDLHEAYPVHRLPDR